MSITPAKLHTALAARLPAIVTLAGDETLLVQEALDAVRAKARKEGFSERLSLAVEPGFSWGALLDECNSPSLFAPLRLIEVHMPRGPNGHRRGKSDEDSDGDEGKGAGEDGAKVLVQLAARPPRDVLLLITTGALDKTQRDSKWFTALEGAGLAMYAHPLPPEELPGFIAARAKAAELTLSPEAALELAERTEGNLLACAQDIAKLALLFPGQSIDAETLAQAVADSSRFEAFTLVEKMLVGQPQAAVHALQRLREEGVSALELVGALAYAMRTWATAGAVYARSKDLNAALMAARLFGTRRAPYETALKRSRGFSPAAALVKLAGVDQAVKTGREAFAWEELLTLVLAASGAAKQAEPSRG